VPNAKPELTGVGNGERPAPDAVKRLVDRFYQDRKVFLSADYKEEQLRAEFGQGPCRLRFLNPFFTALGWNLRGRGGSS
jgi:hypothetical protein